MDKKKIKKVIDVLIYVLTAVAGWLTGSAFCWIV